MERLSHRVGLADEWREGWDQEDRQHSDCNDLQQAHNYLHDDQLRAGCGKRERERRGPTTSLSQQTSESDEQDQYREQALRRAAVNETVDVLAVAVGPQVTRNLRGVPLHLHVEQHYRRA